MLQDNDTVFRATCKLDASPESVFDAWTEQAQWEQWLGSAGMRCDVPLLERRPGGHFKVVMHPASGPVTKLDGEYRTFEQPHKLGFSWWVEGSDARTTLITVNLEADGDGTELSLRHEGLSSAASRDSHGKSWQESFDKLKIFLAGSRDRF
ncbi:MAG TPA: SRPBCC domain-containing protein [Steroidobacteraceae bacterium]|jgi:uncharacterized protein YndB with AHSA1/START domain|nr:SRPBCC domain-containing protein [Steroidobacteraceae bacterium]